MFCVQCEQTRRSSGSNGCTLHKGVCGKTEEVSDLQDILVFHLQGVSFWASFARQQGVIIAEIDEWVPHALFSTLTNVNFDPQRILSFIQNAQRYKLMLQQALLAPEIQSKLQKRFPLPQAAHVTVSRFKDEVLAQAEQASLRSVDEDNDRHGWRLLCLYGLKGAAAYMDYAFALGQKSELVYTIFHQLMSQLLKPLTENELLEIAMKVGELNYQVMLLLDTGATAKFGHPRPTEVNTKPVAGKCILVSGHDLHDLYCLLQQTQDSGIQVYTHGEMLPAHSYPVFQQFTHLVGHYGGAWHEQQTEFATFPGAIVMTSNCLIDPNAKHYGERIFTTNIVGWPSVKHITERHFSEVIKCANQLAGFESSQPPEMIMTGFGRKTLLSSVPTLKNLVSAGKVKHFFVIGGCDGGNRKRNYFTEYAEKVPDDALILTLGCGKFRFNRSVQGNVHGLPKVFDAGQCNDAFAIIELALELSKTFGCSVNDLPLTLVLSWFEQKAIVILLSLLYLGVKGIYTGPTAPAFLTENNLITLQNMFDLRVTGLVEDDLRCALEA